jgi:hypothetical protein
MNKIDTVKTEGSFMWVYKLNDQGQINAETKPITFRSRQQWANHCDKYVGAGWAMHDTLGQWYRVIERRFVGHETISIDPPIMLEKINNA